MIYMVVALECPSALRKFIPLCEARRHENAARLQCWEGAALENYRKCESNRAPRRNSTPRGARSRSDRITPETDSFGRRLSGLPICGSVGRGPKVLRKLFFQEILSGLRIFGFVGLGPNTSITVLCKVVLGGLPIFWSVELDPKSLFVGSPMRFGSFRIGR